MKTSIHILIIFRFHYKWNSLAQRFSKFLGHAPPSTSQLGSCPPIPRHEKKKKMQLEALLSSYRNWGCLVQYEPAQKRCLSRALNISNITSNEASQNNCAHCGYSLTKTTKLEDLLYKYLRHCRQQHYEKVFFMKALTILVFPLNPEFSPHGKQWVCWCAIMWQINRTNRKWKLPATLNQNKLWRRDCSNTSDRKMVENRRFHLLLLKNTLHGFFHCVFKKKSSMP